MAILDDVKTTLRIRRTTLLDTEITAKIAAARAEMQRVGISTEKAESDTDLLILEAIKTYCQWKFTDDEKQVANYKESWECQIDGLRKSSEYMAEVD